MKLGKMSVVTGLALSCCLACDSGNTTVSGGQPPSSSPASTPAPVSSAPASSQTPEAPASAGQAASAAGKSQYLSNLHSVARSGGLLTGDLQVNDSDYPHSVIQSLGPGPDSVSYDIGRQWRMLDMTLGLSDSTTGDETVRFQVKADNRIIYTGNVTFGQSRHVRLDVTGVARLDLITTLMSDKTGSVFSDWANAELLS